MLFFETTNVPRPNGEPAGGALPAPNARLNTLSLEHDDLDFAIAALLTAGTRDDLLIARFKKRKLQIKDEIASVLAAAQPPGDLAARAT